MSHAPPTFRTRSAFSGGATHDPRYVAWVEDQAIKVRRICGLAFTSVHERDEAARLFVDLSFEERAALWRRWRRVAREHHLPDPEGFVDAEVDGLLMDYVAKCRATAAQAVPAPAPHPRQTRIDALEARALSPAASVPERRTSALKALCLKHGVELPVEEE